MERGMGGEVKKRTIFVSNAKNRLKHYPSMFGKRREMNKIKT